MMIRNKVAYTRKKQKKLRKKEKETGKTIAVFKKPYKKL